MAKINVNFNNKTYSIDESALQNATDALKSHLSTVMNGSGASIKLGGVSYNIDSTKLSAATNSFVSHLGTIAGGNAGGGDTLTWDGNTDGRVLNPIADGMGFVKISDATPTVDDMSNGGSLTLYAGDMSMPCEFTVVSNEDGVISVCDAVIVVPSEAIGVGVDVGGATLVFSETGTYTTYGMGITGLSLTIPGYTGFPAAGGTKLTVNGVEYSIDPEKVAGSVAELEEVFGNLESGGSDSNIILSWNSIEVKDNVQGGSENLPFVKISETPFSLTTLEKTKLTATDRENSTTSVYDYESVTMNIPEILIIKHHDEANGQYFEFFSVSVAGTYIHSGYYDESIYFPEPGFYTLNLGMFDADVDFILERVGSDYIDNEYPIEWNTMNVANNSVRMYDDVTDEIFIKISDITPLPEEAEKLSLVVNMQGQEITASHLGNIIDPTKLSYGFLIYEALGMRIQFIVAYSAGKIYADDRYIIIPEAGLYAPDFATAMNIDADCRLELACGG